jgi:type VI secretion system protein ImpA
MVDFPFDKLSADVSDGQPSGPDLEFDGDDEFMAFMAQIDGVLPTSFASFDRATADLPTHIASAAALVIRSKDLRILTSAAKLMILDRDLGAFHKALQGVAGWLRERWDTLLPELMDGDATMRLIALQSLDDVPHTVKPLEAAPLFRSRRIGAVSLRSSLLASGTLVARQTEEGGEAEKTPTLGDIAAAIAEADLKELVAMRDIAAGVVAALNEIETLWAEKGSVAGQLGFGELKPKAVEVRTFLDKAVVSRDPSLGLDPTAGGGEGGEDEDGAPVETGAVGSLDAARSAMAAAEKYFRRKEPSSPVRLVLAQASALIGKGFYESLQQLMPDIANQASVSLGRDLPLKLPLERLATLIAEDTSQDEDEAPEEAPAESPSADDGWSSNSDGWSTPEETPSDAPDPETGEQTAADADGGEAHDQAEETAHAVIEEEPAPAFVPPPAPPAGPAVFKAATRQQAMALLNEVAMYFRMAEPSSPIPMLIDIARAAAGRDFMQLLRETLPPHTLRVDE